MRLFCDPDVTWAGVKVGGIRINAMSGIESRTSVLLTVSRGKRSECIIEPLKDEPQSPPVADRVSKALAAIGKCKNNESLQTVLAKMEQLWGDCDDEQKRALKAAVDSAEERLK